MKTEKNVYAKMAIIKSELSKRKIEKSGLNKYSGFKYHELQDFMPHILELNNTYGVNAHTQFLKKEGICTIKIMNVDDASDSYTVVIPFVEAEMLGKGGSPSVVDAIQRIGSTLTYNRRYLFMTAYDVVENDAVNATSGRTETAKKHVKVDVNACISKLTAAKTLNELAKAWDDLTAQEKNNPLVLAKKDELKTVLK